MPQSLLPIDEQVRAFVVEAVCKKPNEISPATTLLGDLGMDGDDADEFIIEFAGRFNVDMTGYNFLHNFGQEGIYFWQFRLLIWRAIRGLRGEDPHEIAGLSPIMVEDLIRSAKTGRWKDTELGGG